MHFPSRFSILLDGAFVLKKLNSCLGRFPSASDVVELCDRIRDDSRLADLELLRIYYYDARQATGELVNPVDGSVLNLTTTAIFARHERLLRKLELQADLALRLGEVVTHEWRIGQSAMRNLQSGGRTMEARDLVPNIIQKGVDLRMGLDIARAALTKSVSTIIAVTGDSDLIPAFKFARREGIRVFLDTMQHGVKRELKAHCDQLMNVAGVDRLGRRRTATEAPA